MLYVYFFFHLILTLRDEVSPVGQMRTLRLKEIRQFAQGPTSRKSWKLGAPTSPLTPKPLPVTPGELKESSRDYGGRAHRGGC